MGNLLGRRDSEQAGISAPDIPQPNEQKSSDRTHVGVASFVVHDNSRVEQSHTDSKFIAIDSSTHRPQPLLDGTEGDSEQAGTSTFGASSQTMSMSGDHTQVGSTLALAQKGATVHLNIHGTNITMGPAVRSFRDRKRPCDQVVTALSLAQPVKVSKSRKSQRSTLHNMDTPPNQENISSRSEEIGKLVKKVIEEWSSVLCIQDNLISRIEKLLPKDSKKIFSVMVEILDYFMRDKESVEKEYRIERVLAFIEGRQESFKTVTYDELKKLILEATSQHLAIAGPAGSGKSTLLKRIVTDLSSDENSVLSEKLIVFLNFRDIYSEKNITPRELLFHGLFEDKSLRVECYEWLLENQEKIIFFLDGLDQARFLVRREAKLLRPHSKSSASDIISNILSRKLFPKSKIVYTSREHSISSLEDPLRPDKVISLTGFSHEDAEYLFTNAVNDGQDFWNKMEASLKALVTIPVFLTFTVFVYTCNPRSPPTSMTEVMQRLIDGFMLSKNVLNRDVSGKIPTTTLNGLRELSFMGLRQRKLSFGVENFREVHLELQEVRDFVIIVLGQPSSNPLPTFCVFDGHYVIFFTHQSIQEFFAAQYIVQLDLELFRKVVDEQLGDDYWSVVTRFASGILLNQNRRPNANISDITEKQKILKRMLTEKYGKSRAVEAQVPSKLSTLASIAETEDRNFIQSLVKNISLQYHPIGISGISSIASIMRHCSHLESLELIRCGLSADVACFLWRNIAHSSVKIDELNVSWNKKLGNAFQHIRKIAAHCDVRELRACDCNLRDSQCWKDIKSSQLRLLNLYGNELSEVIFSVIGIIIDNGGKLFLPEISPTIVSGVQLLEKALGVKKLKDLHIGNAEVAYRRIQIKKGNGKKPDPISLKIPDTFFASLGNIIADSGSLTLRNIKATSSGLQRLKLTLDTKKLGLLDLRGNELSEVMFSVIGDIIGSGGELFLPEISPTIVSGVQLLEKALGAKKLKGLRIGTEVAYRHIKKKVPQFYPISLKIPDTFLASLGTIIADSGSLTLRDIDATSSGLQRLKLALDKKKISRLDLSYSKFDAPCYEVIGNIVKSCSIDDILLCGCEITADALVHFLSAANGAKISNLDLSYNDFDTSCIWLLGKISYCCSADRFSLVT